MGMVAFYYPWYGNPQTDGKWLHWNHEIFDKSHAHHQVCQPASNFSLSLSLSPGVFHLPNTGVPFELTSFLYLCARGQRVSAAVLIRRAERRVRREVWQGGWMT